MNKIRAIPTVYNGVEFRSRLEARWAVFFDNLGVQWDYEIEGFEWSDGGKEYRYLPDFYFPVGDGIYGEVKAGTPTKKNRNKMLSFVRHKETSIMLLYSKPKLYFDVLSYGLRTTLDSLDNEWFSDNRTSIDHYDWDDLLDKNEIEVIDAIEAFLSAKFEFGRNG